MSDTKERMVSLHDVESESYKAKVTITNFNVVGGKIFATRLGSTLPVRSLDALYKLFLESPVPCFDRLLELADNGECGIPKSTLYKLRAKLIKAGLVDRDTFCFVPEFFHEYAAGVKQYIADVECMDSGVRDSEALGTSVIHPMFTYDTVMKIMKSSRDVKFEFPEEYELSDDLDYNSDRVQFIELTNFGRCTRVPRVLQYMNRCSLCFREDKQVREIKPTKCDYPTRSVKPNSRGEMVEKVEYCNGKMMPIETEYITRSLHMGLMQFNYNNVHVFSLVDFPEGTTRCAVFVCTNATRTMHYLFVIALNKTEYVSTVYQPSLNKHVAYEMVDDVDDSHDAYYGRHVVGLDGPKLGILFGFFMNLRGNTGFNSRLYGRSGTGKSAASFVMSHALTDRASYLDAYSTSHAGLVGHLVTIKIDGQEISYVEYGSMGKDLIVVVDEIESNPKLAPHLKTALDNEELTKQVARAPFRISKTATVVVTGNIDSTHLLSVQKEFANLMFLYKTDRPAFESYDSFTADAVDWFKLKKVYNPLPEDVVSRAILSRERAHGRNYIDGEDISVLNRFAFIFYIGKDGEDNVDEFLPSKLRAGKKFLIGSVRGHECLYVPQFADYLRMCVKYDPEIPSEMYEDIDLLYKELYEYDHIHSTGGRLNDLLMDVLKMSAAINQRDVVMYVDMLFARDLWKQMLRHVEPKQLIRASYWDGHISELRAKELLGLRKPSDPVGVVLTTRQEIEKVISDTLGGYEMSDDDELRLIKKVVDGLVVSLVHDFELSTLDATYMVDAYIASRQPCRDEIDQTIEEIIVPTKNKKNEIITDV